MRLLQDLIDLDIAERNGSLGVATEGLLWLKRFRIEKLQFLKFISNRGLEFMLELLKQLVKEYRSSATNGDLAKTESLTGILRNSYEKTLQRHHNFVSKQLFKVLSSLVR